MLDNFLVLVGQVAALFIMMGVGLFLTKKNLVTEQGASQMTTISLNVVTPCLIINSLQREKSMDLLQEVGICIAIVVAVILLGMVVSLLFFKKQIPEQKRVLRFASSFSNCGYMGLPLVQAVLGDGAVIYASAAVIGFNLMLWTAGVMQMGGKKYVSLKKALINPGTISFAVGFLLFWFEIELPAVAGSVLSMFASMNTPLAMLIIGTYFAQTKVKEFFEHKSLYLVCLLRLIVLPVITVFMLYPLHLPYELYAAIVITTSAPTAAATTMFAAKFGADTKIASQSVTLCTLFSIITMPLFAALVSLLCA